MYNQYLLSCKSQRISISSTVLVPCSLECLNRNTHWKVPLASVTDCQHCTKPVNPGFFYRLKNFMFPFLQILSSWPRSFRLLRNDLLIRSVLTNSWLGVSAPIGRAWSAKEQKFMQLLWVKASSESRAEGQQEEEFPSVKFTIQYLQPCIAAHMEKLVLY